MKVAKVENRDDLVAYLADEYGFDGVLPGNTVMDGYSNPQTAPYNGTAWDLWHIADRETNTHVDYVWMPSGSSIVSM